jgi:hypothetical protein
VNIGKWRQRRKVLSKKDTDSGRDDRGQAIIEFVLVVPIVLILFISVVLFSFMLYSFVTLSHGAREGARYIVGAPQAPDTEVETYIETRFGLLDPNQAVIVIEPEPSERQPGANVTVTISYPFQLVDVYVPYIIAPGGFRMFPPIWLRGVSTMYMD